jgi:hypothetical protein
MPQPSTTSFLAVAVDPSFGTSTKTNKVNNDKPPIRRSPQAAYQPIKTTPTL